MHMFDRRTKPRYWAAALVFLLLILVVFAIIYSRGVARVNEFERQLAAPGTRLLDSEGNLLTTLGTGSKVAVKLPKIPDSLENAVIAIEDSRFYYHPGIDPIGIARAVWADIKAGAPVQGASTITQQLARNLFLGPEKTFARKIEESVLALVLESRYTKDQILELYLNQVYFGEGAYGVENAARVYFDKPVKDLTLPESALLAGLLRAPSTTSPYSFPERAETRRNLVLNRMAELDFITEREAARAKLEKFELARGRVRRAPYFVDMVTRELVELYGATTVFTRGLTVHTTLDPDMQAAAEEAWDPSVQGALVAMDPQTGHIKALLGGRDYRESQFNRAVLAFRQPGSAFKPFVYLAALKEDWRLNSIVEDIPREFDGYKPTNFEEAFWGPVTMNHAVTLSLNNAAVWTLDKIGVDKVLDLSKQLGIKSLVPQDRNLALALGGLTKGVTPLELTAAFLPFTNGGFRFEPATITRVVNQDGKVILDRRPEGTKVIEPQLAYLMTDMLRSVIENGTGQPAAIDRPAAGKTGTTDNRVSLWFVGYTPDLLATVYVGNDDGSPMSDVAGPIAGPIWKEFMTRALDAFPPRDFPVPDNIVTDVEIDVFTGLLASPYSKLTELDSFIKGTEPTQAVRGPEAAAKITRARRQLPPPFGPFPAPPEQRPVVIVPSPPQPQQPAPEAPQAPEPKPEPEPAPEQELEP